MRNLARALILSKHGRIWTTMAKAKEVRPFVERLVTLGRAGDETSRRRAVAMLGEHEPSHPRSAKADQKGAVKWARIPPKPANPHDRKRWRRLGLPVQPKLPPVVAVQKLFADIAPQFKNTKHQGGYVRILRGSRKIGDGKVLRLRRLNDKAELALLEFVVSMGESPGGPPEAKVETKKAEATKAPAASAP